jgi:hypothetical protein
MDHPFRLFWRGHLVYTDPLSGNRIIGLNQPRGISRNNTAVRKASGYNTIRSDHAIPAQPQLTFGAKYYAAVPQPTVPADYDPTSLIYALRMNRQAGIEIFVVVIHDEHLWC